MSYYEKTSVQDILRDIVTRELYEFSGGRAVYSPMLKQFTLKLVAVNIALMVLSVLFIPVNFLISVILFIAAIYNLVKYFKSDKLVFFVMKEAQKRPNEKISDIIWELCTLDEALSEGSFFIENKPTVRHGKKPLIIVLCSVLGTILLITSVYLFVPFTIYEDVDGGCAVKYARTGLAGYAAVEESHDGKPVVGIKSGAYKNNPFLSYIDLPKSLTFIEGKAFMNCLSLKEITIPYKVTELRGDTFRSCLNLKSVTLHDDITEIHAFCFMGCKRISSITLPKNITEIHESTFNNCTSLVKIEIPDGVTRIAARAFYNCDSLKTVILPESLTEIGSSSFRSCARLKNIEIPNGCEVNERSFKESPTTITYK